MNGLKIIAAFAAGMGCGILAGKLYFESKYRAIADEEIESVIDVYRKKTEELEEKEEDKKEYHKHVDNYISSTPISFDVERTSEIVKEVEENEHPEDDIPDEQYQITSMDYFDDGEFDKINVTYYANDRVLVGVEYGSEDEEEHILDIPSTVGTDAIDLICNGFDDGSALYIRNPKTSKDYEIVKSYLSYKDMMLNE